MLVLLWTRDIAVDLDSSPCRVNSKGDLERRPTEEGVLQMIEQDRSAIARTGVDRLNACEQPVDEGEPIGGHFRSSFVRARKDNFWWGCQNPEHCSSKRGD